MTRIAFALVAAFAAGCASGAHSSELRTIRLDEGTVCDGVTRVLSWTNETGAPALIRKLTLFEGVNDGAKCDVAFEIHRRSDDAVIAAYPRDAYAGSDRDCTPYDTSFDGDAMTIAPGDSIDAGRTCWNLNGSCTEIAYAAWIWYASGS